MQKSSLYNLGSVLQGFFCQEGLQGIWHHHHLGSWVLIFPTQGICHWSSRLTHGGSLNSLCCCRESLWVSCGSHHHSSSSSLSPAVTIFFLSISHMVTNQESKYHSLKQLSLGQHEAHYPIQDLVQTKQIHRHLHPTIAMRYVNLPSLLYNVRWFTLWVFAHLLVFFLTRCQNLSVSVWAG